MLTAVRYLDFGVVNHLCLNAESVAARDDGIHTGMVSRAYAASWSLVALTQRFPHIRLSPPSEGLSWTVVLFLPNF